MFLQPKTCLNGLFKVTINLEIVQIAFEISSLLIQINVDIYQNLQIMLQEFQSLVDQYRVWDTRNVLFELSYLDSTGAGLASTNLFVLGLIFNIGCNVITSYSIKPSCSLSYRDDDLYNKSISKYKITHIAQTHIFLVCNNLFNIIVSVFKLKRNLAKW